MGIYYGYSLFRKYGILFDGFSNWDPEFYIKHDILGECGFYYKDNNRIAISVKSKLSSEDKVKVYIHELLHVAYHYNYLLDDKEGRKLLRLSPWPYPFTLKEEEEGMTKLAEDIYNSQPRLVAMLRKDLENAMKKK